MFNGQRILVAPLDWGLGHASRCAPLIQQLIISGAEPIIGANGNAAIWLKKRFPQLIHVEIPGMEVTYSSKRSQVWSMAKQLPAYIQTIANEQSTLPSIISEHGVDAVISDQRFGLHSDAVPSVIITHQTHPIVPFAQHILRSQNRRWLAPFDEVWIPDDGTKLAGSLSDSLEQPPCHYIGHLSRFQHLRMDEDTKYTCVAIISGPEPHRTALQDRVLSQLPSIQGEHLMLTGQPTIPTTRVRATDMFGDMPDGELLPHLLGCKLIIARSGYSTLMDLHSIQKGALIIPTPGQPEQEYLASIHAGRNGLIVQDQDELDIVRAMRNASIPTTSRSSEKLIVRSLERLSQMISR